MSAQTDLSKTHDAVHRRGWIVGLGLVTFSTVALLGCKGGQDLFSRLAEARRLAADLRIQLS